MAKGNVKFTGRVKATVKELAKDSELQLVPVRSGSLFTPILRGDNYEWVKVMDSDGTLAGPRKVTAGEGAEPESEVELLIGVVLQSEDTTTKTKPNPIGKASLGHVKNGIWVDVAKEGRRRLDRVHVLMVVPKGAVPKLQKDFLTAQRNVLNAADMMPDCEVLIVERGVSASDLVKEVKKKVRKNFKGRGRPKAS